MTVSTTTAETTRLALARAAHQPGSRTPHTVVFLPSYSVGESLMSHYAPRLLGMEHRHLLSVLMLPRVPGAQLVFVTSLRPARAVLDYYLSLVAPEHRRSMRARMRVLEVPDASPRSVTAKLLDRPDLVARLRRMTRGRLAYLEPWNVTCLEEELAQRLDLPVNGTAPGLWPLGFKSNGRKVMRAAGVPIPAGEEDVRSVDGVVAAAEAVRRLHPAAPGVVVKTDNSAAGDGNRVIRFADADAVGGLRAAVASLDPAYLADLAQGAAVEELIQGEGFCCPSVQVDVEPGGGVHVVSTHEQLLGGASGQVYLGCRFPADPGYRTRLAAYGEAVGQVLAARGVVGRLGVDFAAVRSPIGGWDVYGLEINLRKGGTTHPLSVLHNLVPGRYDPASGRWVAEDGSHRFYRSTDNLVDPVWRGRSAHDVIAAVRRAGLDFDRCSGTGVVLHAFCGLDVDGRLGATAVGVSPDHAEELYGAMVSALSGDNEQAKAPRLVGPRGPVWPAPDPTGEHAR